IWIPNGSSCWRSSGFNFLVRIPFLNAALKCDYETAPLSVRVAQFAIHDLGPQNRDVLARTGLAILLGLEAQLHLIAADRQDLHPDLPAGHLNTSQLADLTRQYQHVFPFLRLGFTARERRELLPRRLARLFFRRGRPAEHGSQLAGIHI